MSRYRSPRRAFVPDVRTVKDFTLVYQVANTLIIEAIAVTPSESAGLNSPQAPNGDLLRSRRMAWLRSAVSMPIMDVAGHVESSRE